ncbi:uncharacterized protein [Rutidosis leptorrhynchoides]|uniref:uncharacterized protein n=1 Tax=Rutidosis leptorrhynchoides TaxID=125765 RepID=UPI003A998275
MGCWRRTPTGRANGELETLTSLISTFHLDHNAADIWKWSLDSDGLFMVKSLASEIDDRILGSNSFSVSTIRNNLAPKKLEISAWRALHKRLPVRLELDKRGIGLHSVRCPLCDDDLKSVDHSIIFCQQSLDIWERVFKWWDVGPFSSFSVNEVLGMVNNPSMSKFGGMLWLAVRWVSAYIIWKNRNNKVFNGKCWNTPMVFNEIQIKSFEWLSPRAKGRKLEWLTWLSNPYTFLTAP